MTATEVLDRSLAKYGLEHTLNMYAKDCDETYKKEMTAFIHEREELRLNETT